MKDVVDLLAKGPARDILAAASTGPKSVAELCEECDLSRTSAYRYVERLARRDLLAEEFRLGPDGNHYGVYETRFRCCLLVLEEGEFRPDVCCSRRACERLVRLWKQLRA